MVARLRADVAGGRKTVALDLGCGGWPICVIGFWLDVVAALAGMLSDRPVRETRGV